MTRSANLVGVMGLLLTAAGCSFSDSSVSISKSISSPFESSSESSPSRDAYQNDVADYTYGHIISNGTPENFWRGIASIAERRGVTNYETDSDTYVGIGQGAGRAKLAPAAFEAFSQNLSGGDARKQQWMRQGYESAGKQPQ